mgnify:CR=1 FL=1
MAGDAVQYCSLKDRQDQCDKNIGRRGKVDQVVFSQKIPQSRFKDYRIKFVRKMQKYAQA